MTEARAVARYLKIGPRKMRLVMDAIRQMPADRALIQLMHRPMKAARLAVNVLKGAMANAQAKKMDRNRLVVSEIRVDGGPSMKRLMPRSMGRADRILKRSTHLTIVLRESNVAPQIKVKPASEEGKAEKKIPAKPKANVEKAKAGSAKKTTTAKKTAKATA